MLFALLLVLVSYCPVTNGLFFKRNSYIYLEKRELSTDPLMVLGNATIDDGTFTAYFSYLVDVPSPIHVVLTVKHFWNGAYVKSFLNIDLELCSFLKATGQNLVFRKMFDYIRSMGKIGNRCPLKRDLYYVKNAVIPENLIPEVLPSDRYFLNFQMEKFINLTIYFRLKPKAKNV